MGLGIGLAVTLVLLVLFVIGGVQSHQEDKQAKKDAERAYWGEDD